MACTVCRRNPQAVILCCCPEINRFFAGMQKANLPTTILKCFPDTSYFNLSTGWKIQTRHTLRAIHCREKSSVLYKNYPIDICIKHWYNIKSA